MLMLIIIKFKNYNFIKYLLILFSLNLEFFYHFLDNPKIILHTSFEYELILHLIVG